MLSHITLALSVFALVFSILALRSSMAASVVEQTIGQSRWLYWPDHTQMVFNPRYWAIWTHGAWLKWVDARNKHEAD